MPVRLPRTLPLRGDDLPRWTKRTLVPAMLPIVPLDGRTNIPSSLPLESIAARTVVPRGIRREDFAPEEPSHLPFAADGHG